jgi:hypothetical protein
VDAYKEGALDCQTNVMDGYIFGFGVVHINLTLLAVKKAFNEHMSKKF